VNASNPIKQSIIAVLLIVAAQATPARYRQADPIGMQGGLNRYSYAELNPLKWVDPLGLATDAEIRRAVATLRCASPSEFSKAAKSITMTDLSDAGTGRTDWFNNVELNSRAYGDSNTHVSEFDRDRFLQTLAHEMLHVNENAGSFLLSNQFRMGSRLGYFHQQLNDKAEAMITSRLLDQYRNALNNGDAGCTCTR
jgi:uncharacterized protein RhaS with RHS repeats